MTVLWIKMIIIVYITMRIYILVAEMSQFRNIDEKSLKIGHFGANFGKICFSVNFKHF